MTGYEWVIKYRKVLKISKIERTIGCPRGTINKALAQERGLPEKWINELNIFVPLFLSGDIDKYQKRYSKKNRIKLITTIKRNIKIFFNRIKKYFSI